MKDTKDTKNICPDCGHGMKAHRNLVGCCAFTENVDEARDAWGIKYEKTRVYCYCQRLEVER